MVGHSVCLGLMEMQRKWYRSVLEKDIDAVNGEHGHIAFETPILCYNPGLTGKKEGKTCLMVMVMQVSSHLQSFSCADPVCVQLRKVTCHPYLFDGAVRLVLS